MSHFVEIRHILKEKERDTMSFSIISIRQLASWQTREGTILIDLREREEYQEEHIKGAVNIPYERWEQEKDGWRHQFTYLIFYCERGNQSMYAAREMNRLGYHAASIAGGFESYRIWMDETDSGLDVDAVRLVSKGIEHFIEKKDRSLLIITPKQL